MKRLIKLTLGITLALLLISEGAAQDTQSARMWKEFSEWARKTPDYGDLQGRYKQELLAGGMAEKDADEVLAVIRTYAKEHREDAIALHFNKVYTIDQTGFFVKEANAFLVSAVRDQKPGTALDVAMGQGRNGLYLASQGWDVTGFDIAEDGLTAARATAQKAGIRFNAVYARLQDFEFGSERWDLVFFIYAFAHLSDPALVQRVWESLKPDGLVLIEHPMGEPNKPWEEHDRLNALPKAWGEKFRILQYEDVHTAADWHQLSITKRREDPVRVVRFLARKYETGR